jgi:hypothetical protein
MLYNSANCSLLNNAKKLDDNATKLLKNWGNTLTIIFKNGTIRYENKD